MSAMASCWKSRLLDEEAAHAVHELIRELEHCEGTKKLVREEKSSSQAAIEPARP